MGQLAINDTTVEVNDEGFLTSPDDWNEDIAVALAQVEGINLSDEHWKVIRFMRDDFTESGKVPTIRRIKKAGGVPIKDIYRLFPDGPAKKAARIAGLSKPEGCV
jgi:tRNA 2-thiouridine synthesizing protein E